MIVEQDYIIGGSFLNQQDKKELEEQEKLLKKLGVTILTRTTAFGLYDNTTVGLIEIIPSEGGKDLAKKPRQRFKK